MSTVKKIAAKDLRPGMEIARMGSRLWEHLPHLYTKPGVLRSREEINALLDSGYTEAFVVEEAPDDGLNPDERMEKIVLDGGDYLPPEKPREEFKKVLPEVTKAYDKAIATTHNLLDDVRMGRPPDVDTSQAIVDNMVISMARNPDALMCLSKISTYDNYTYTHSINVAAIALAFGEFLNLSREELRLLGLAGLLHDLGKVKVPDHIINKAGRLSDREFRHVKRHPGYGVDILKDAGKIPSEVVRAVAEHHEKFNGAGYPQGKRKEEISALGRILALADVYDALTSRRVYKEPIAPNKAMAIMYGMADQDFDSNEVQLFVKCLGIYPTGSLVRLQNGQHALVIGANPKRPLLPTIVIALDQHLRPIKKRTVNLEEEGDPNLTIVECLGPAEHSVDLEKIVLQ